MDSTLTEFEAAQTACLSHLTDEQRTVEYEGSRVVIPISDMVPVRVVGARDIVGADPDNIVEWRLLLNTMLVVTLPPKCTCAGCTCHVSVVARRGAGAPVCAACPCRDELYTLNESIASTARPVLDMIFKVVYMTPSFDLTCDDEEHEEHDGSKSYTHQVRDTPVALTH
jgi:hypothetical protein